MTDKGNLRKTKADSGAGVAYTSSTVRRTVQILRQFTFENPEWGCSELARKMGWKRPTVHRILMSLREEGLVEVDTRTGKYHLSVRVFELAGVVLNRLGLTAKAYPHLSALTSQTGLAANLGVFDGKNDIVYIDKIEAGTHLQLSVRPGARLPVHRTALGRAILAQLPDHEVELILQRADLSAATPYTITSREEIMRCLRQVREQGYAIDNQENSVGIIGLGAAVLNYARRPLAGISIGGPTALLGPDRIPELGRALRETALEISKACGASPEDFQVAP